MVMADSTVRVGLVFPELLGTYGDRGNAIVLVQRARWRGIPAELVEVAADEPIPSSLDVYLLGGGEDDPQHLAAANLRASRGALEQALGGGAVMLAVCAGFQLVGHRYVLGDGSVLEGVGLLDLETRASPDRLIGDEIPKLARILHVADAFEAMISDRPYRTAPGQEFAIEELRRHAGTQFDEQVVEALMRVLGVLGVASTPVEHELVA